jgi:hypothetical protein
MFTIMFRMSSDDAAKPPSSDEISFFQELVGTSSQEPGNDRGEEKDRKTLVINDFETMRSTPLREMADQERAARHDCQFPLPAPSQSALFPQAIATPASIWPARGN